MANSKSSPNIRSLVYSGKQSLLPPKSPFPSISPSYVDYVPSPTIGSRAIQKPREGNSHHLRTSSESVLIEEQPSWLDDLLNEPETPVRRGGHRRSSSDSFAYIDATASNIGYSSQNEYKHRNLASIPSWGIQEMGQYRDPKHASLYVGQINQNNRSWDSSLNSMAYINGLPSARDNITIQKSGLSSAPYEADRIPPTATDKLERANSCPNDQKTDSEKKDCFSTKPSALETDTKRAKQQFAQRSRVRKLQYIAELERNVQALQVEGSEVSAELEFLNQQNLILSMENKSLKQRLESITQEQLIKYMEQEVLEREIGRLRAVYQQQLQQPSQQQPLSNNHRRTRSQDLDSQFSNLSLNSRDAASSRDTVSGSLRI